MTAKHTAIIKSGVFILLSLVLGKYVLVPLIPYVSDTILAFAIGLSFLTVIVTVIKAVGTVRPNLLIREEIKRVFPESEEELRQAGVKSELDFSYAMMCIFTVEYVSIIGDTLHSPVTYYNRRLYKKSIKMFEEMFGRLPENAWSLNWSYIAQSEAARAFDTPISYGDFMKYLSDGVADYYDVTLHMQKNKDAA